MGLLLALVRNLFQSTLRARRSDSNSAVLREKTRNISIHAPRKAERPYAFSLMSLTDDISIHAPRKAERPLLLCLVCREIGYFNPRSAQGGATIRSKQEQCIHEHFNPRSAQGGATKLAQWLKREVENFNPRSAQGGATMFRRLVLEIRHGISIHAPRKAERRGRCVLLSVSGEFQSTLRARRSDRD